MRRKLEKATHRLRVCVGAVAFMSIVGGTTPAMAAEDAVVEALIQRGIQLRRSGEDDQALTVFLEAERQDPKSVRVLLHVVTAAQAAGKWLMADSYMRKVSALKDDEYYRRHADAIDVVRRSIAARIGTFQAQGEPDGASVRLDGQLIGTLPMSDPVSVESGTYQMEVYKPGFYRLRRSVNVVGGVLTREPVELNVVPARADAAAAGTLSSDGSASAGAPDQEGSWLTSPTTAWTLVGLGVASSIASGVAFQLREDRVSTWNDENECVREDGSTRQATCGDFKSDAETFQTVGIATAIAGVALAGTGVALLIAGGDSTEKPSSDTASTGGLKLTSCGAGLMSLACRGSF
jgi:hypothetical protein